VKKIANRIRSVGAVFSIYQIPLTLVLCIQPISQRILENITEPTDNMFLEVNSLGRRAVISPLSAKNIQWLQ
jgi:hypothetical protein